MLPTPSGRGRRVRWVAAGVLFVAIVSVWWLRGPLLGGFARLFRVDNPAPSDVLVVLLGNWSCRPLRAAELYHERIAPTVLMGTSTPIPYADLNETTLDRRVLIRAGVPDSAITVLPGIVTSTREEAFRVRDYLKTHPARRVTIVTTAFHTGRARWIFRRVLRGTGVDVRAASAADPRYDEATWYTTAAGRAAYLQEVPKWLYYRIAY